jgi:hypothetical protein
MSTGCGSRPAARSLARGRFYTKFRETRAAAHQRRAARHQAKNRDFHRHEASQSTAQMRRCSHHCWAMSWMLFIVPDSGTTKLNFNK